jgi:hypothetical protein
MSTNTPEMITPENSHDGYQVIVVNIFYKTPVEKSKNKEYPTSLILDIPEGILKCKKNQNKFYDTVEQFVYNTITRKYGTEVTSCQIYLPLENEVAA